MYVGLIVQPTYRIRDGVPVVMLHGRLDDGRAFLVEDDRMRPYFFVAPEARELLAREPRVQLHETPLARSPADRCCASSWTCRARCRACATA